MIESIRSIHDTSHPFLLSDFFFFRIMDPGRVGSGEEPAAVVAGQEGQGEGGKKIREIGGGGGGGGGGHDSTSQGGSRKESMTESRKGSVVGGEGGGGRRGSVASGGLSAMRKALLEKSVIQHNHTPIKKQDLPPWMLHPIMLIYHRGCFTPSC